MKSVKAPVDIGDPAQARVDTIKWLKGEGPQLEHYRLVSPDDDEVLDRFQEDLWVHPDRATGLGKLAVQFLLGAEGARRDLLKSSQARLKADAEALSTRVTEVESKAEVHDKRHHKAVKHGAEGGRVRAIQMQKERDRKLQIVQRIYNPNYKNASDEAGEIARNPIWSKEDIDRPSQRTIRTYLKEIKQRPVVH